MEKKQPLFIHPKDLWQIPDFANKSKSTIYRIYAGMRDSHAKLKHQRLTYQEVSAYLGIDIAQLRQYCS